MKPSANRQNLEKARANQKAIEEKLKEVLKPLSIPPFIEELEEERNAFWVFLKLREHQEALEKKLQESAAINAYGGGFLKGISHGLIRNFGFSRYLSKTGRAA